MCLGDRVILGLYMTKKTTTVVACYSLDGTLLKTYKSAKEASIELNVFPRTIDKCIRGDNKTVHNLLWRRFDIDKVPPTIEALEKKNKTRSIIPIAKVDEKGNIIEVYPSIKKASEMNHLDAHSLRDRLANKYRYTGKAKFRYLDDNEIDKYHYQKGQLITKENRPIKQYSLDDNYITTYPSIQSALKAINKSSRSQLISLCLKGKYQSAYGYKWKYA